VASCLIIHLGHGFLISPLVTMVLQFLRTQNMDEKLKNLILLGKIFLAIIAGLIALSVWLAYELSDIVGTPSFRL
jgi:hypothetical protein